MVFRDVEMTTAGLARAIADLCTRFDLVTLCAAARASRNTEIVFVVNKTGVQSRPESEGGEAYTSTACLTRFSPEGYCLVDSEGAVLEPSGAKASAMTRLLLEWLSRRSEANVVWFWHSVWADAVGKKVSSLPITIDLVNSGIVEVPVVDMTAAPRSPKSWTEIRDWMIRASIDYVKRGVKTLLMPSVGVLTSAASFEELAVRVQAVELACRGALLGAEGIPETWVRLMIEK